MTTSDVKTEFTFMRVLYQIMELFSDSLKIVFFQMQQVFIIESQSELFKLFLQLGNNAKLLILCFLTS